MSDHGGGSVGLPPLYEDLDFLSPMSAQRASSLVRFILDGRPHTVLDLGCGWE